MKIALFRLDERSYMGRALDDTIPSEYRDAAVAAYGSEIRPIPTAPFRKSSPEVERAIVRTSCEAFQRVLNEAFLDIPTLKGGSSHFQVFFRNLPYAEMERSLIEWGYEVVSGDERLGAMGTKPATDLLAPPKTLPLTFEEGRDLYRKSGLVAVPRFDWSPPAARPLVEPHSSLRPLYAECNGLWRTVMNVLDLDALEQKFLAMAERHLEEMGDEPSDPEDIDLRHLGDPSRLVPFGEDGGGDIFFLDPSNPESMPVLRFVHDECCIVRVEASSFPTFIGTHVLRAWAYQFDQVSALRAVQTAWTKESRQATVRVAARYAGSAKKS